MKRRAVVIGLVVVAALMAGGAFLLERALRPCEPLDIQLGRSGCIRVIELPEGFLADTLHVANVGDQVAVVGALANTTQVLVLNTQTWEVINQLPWLEVEAVDFPGADRLPVHFEWGTTRLLRGAPPRVGFSFARIPDGVFASMDVINEQMRFFDDATNELIKTVTLSRPQSRSGMIALSHDGSRFLISLGRRLWSVVDGEVIAWGVADGELTAWDVASGALLYSVASERLWDWDWLTDNQTIVAILREGERSMLALFRLP
jgi:WD40 repeat protein